jgi:hypothetical protein
MANYKKASVVVLANATGTQTLTNAGAGTKMLWTEVADQTNYGPTATHFSNNTFTAPYAGFYQIAVSLYFGSSVTVSAGFITLIKNSNLAGGIILTQGMGFIGAVQNASRVFKLAKGDTISVYAAQTSGADQTPDAINSTLSIVRLANAS